MTAPVKGLDRVSGDQEGQKQWFEAGMDICIHLGAHRCASTSFQQFMRRNRDRLARDGTAFWGPRRTRKGMFEGLLRNPTTLSLQSRRLGQRSVGRIELEIARTEALNDRLVVSEENMLGTMGQNLSAVSLYGQAQARLSRFSPAFGGHKLRLSVAIRSYDSYWASVAAHRLRRGGSLLDTKTCDRLTTQSRRWRDVISDISRSFPEAEIAVWPFEAWAGRCDEQLAIVTGRLAPKGLTQVWEKHNASLRGGSLRAFCFDQDAAQAAIGDGPYMPFDLEQRRKLQADYAFDIDWLRAGADGRATYFEPFAVPAEETFGGRQTTQSQNVRGRPDHVRGHDPDQERRLA